MKKCCIILAIIFSFSWNSSAQSNTINLPFKIGIIAEYGTHIQRIGFMASFYTTVRNHEFDIEYRTYYNFKNLGPGYKYWENSFTAAYTFGFGDSVSNYQENTFFTPVISHLDEKYALSYALTFFLNKIGSKQSIGAISVYIDNWIISSENDLFGNTKGRDKFRTGSLSVGYVSNDFYYSINAVLWTGDTKCAEVKKKINDKEDFNETKNYKARYGYKDFIKCLFGNLSHGILNAKVSYKPDNFFNQNYSASVGIDSENIRHLLQNKIIHDMYFLPEKLVKTKNLHYPMLDENANPFLNEKEQKKKKDKLYFQLGQNPSWNY